MNQNDLLAALLQGAGPKPLMMNPGPALAGLPGTGQISAPTVPQASPPPALMAPAEQRPEMPHQMMPMPSAPVPDQSAGNPIAQGLASFGSPLGQLLGKPGETPTATNTLLQMLFGKGAQGGVSGLLGLLK